MVSRNPKDKDDIYTQSGVGKRTEFGLKGIGDLGRPLGETETV